MRFELTNAEDILLDGRPHGEADGDWYHLRGEFVHLGLLQGFDELLCLPGLHQVETYWYQVETVRKVLKSFHGRVLLADEVGLGKTIEAGMALKEYLLRGMVEKVLILTPASLVGQWEEEMASKFDIPCATSYDAAAAERSGGLLGAAARDCLHRHRAAAGTVRPSAAGKCMTWSSSTKPII